MGFAPEVLTPETLKRLSKRLHQAILADGAKHPSSPMSLSRSREILAKTFSFDSWHAAVQRDEWTGANEPAPRNEAVDANEENEVSAVLPHLFFAHQVEYPKDPHELDSASLKWLLSLPHDQFSNLTPWLMRTVSRAGIEGHVLPSPPAPLRVIFSETELQATGLAPLGLSEHLFRAQGERPAPPVPFDLMQRLRWFAHLFEGPVVSKDVPPEEAARARALARLRLAEIMGAVSWERQRPEAIALACCVAGTLPDEDAGHDLKGWPWRAKNHLLMDRRRQQLLLAKGVPELVHHALARKWRSHAGQELETVTRNALYVDQVRREAIQSGRSELATVAVLLEWSQMRGPSLRAFLNTLGRLIEGVDASAGRAFGLHVSSGRNLTKALKVSQTIFADLPEPLMPWDQLSPARA